MAEAFHRGEDLIGGFCPLEGLRVFVVTLDEREDIRFESFDQGVHAALQLLAGQFGKPPFDLMDPRRRGRGDQINAVMSAVGYPSILGNGSVDGQEMGI